MPVSVGIHDAYVYIISEKGIEKGKDLFVGYLAEYNGDVYAINSLELYQHDDIEGGKSGENYLYRLDGKKRILIGELPYKLLSSDFCIKDDTIYVNSIAWNQLVTFSLSNGKIIEPLYEFDEESRDRYISWLNNESFLIADSTNNRVDIITSN